MIVPSNLPCSQSMICRRIAASIVLSVLVAVEVMGPSPSGKWDGARCDGTRTQLIGRSAHRCRPGGQDRVGVRTRWRDQTVYSLAGKSTLVAVRQRPRRRSRGGWSGVNGQADGHHVAWLEPFGLADPRLHRHDVPAVPSGTATSST